VVAMVVVVMVLRQATGEEGVVRRYALSKCRVCRGGGSERQKSRCLFGGRVCASAAAMVAAVNECARDCAVTKRAGPGTVGR
jgi:hypothetical protein